MSLYRSGCAHRLYSLLNGTSFYYIRPIADYHNPLTQCAHCLLFPVVMQASEFPFNITISLSVKTEYINQSGFILRAIKC